MNWAEKIEWEKFGGKPRGITWEIGRRWWSRSSCRWWKSRCHHWCNLWSSLSTNTIWSTKTWTWCIMYLQKIEKLFTLNLRHWTLRLSGLLASLKTKTTRKATKAWLWNTKRSLKANVRLSNITRLSIRRTIKTKTSYDLIGYSLSPTFGLIP